jgi:HSP20 family protein
MCNDTNKDTNKEEIMRLVRYWPVGSDMRTYTDWLQKEMNRLFESENTGTPSGLFDRAVSPPIDMVETDEAYLVSVDLPGVKENDIELTMANNVLTLRGEKHGYRRPEDSRTVYRNETWSGTFQRTVSFERPVDSERISANLADGVLKIHVPVRNEARTRKIAVGA